MLRNLNFLYLWFVSITTTLAIEIFSVTILVSVFEQTNSVVQAAGVMVARTFSGFLFGPIAGVLVDRFPRKNVLIGMDLIRLVLVAFAWLLLRGGGQVPLIAIYLILSGLAAASVFHAPARLSLIPSFIPRDGLVQANSFIMVSTQIMFALSYILGGWLILTLTVAQITLIISVLFVLAIFAATFMVVPKRKTEESEENKESFKESLVSGWQYLRRHPVARPLTIMETIEHVPHGIWTGALMLAFTLKALDGDAADWSYQVTGYFSGMILGSLGAFTINRWLRQYPGRIIVLAAGLSGVLTLAFASSQSVWVAVAWAFVFGPFFAIRDVAQDSLLQGTVDEAQLGRVYATREMLRSLMFMFSGLFFAWLSEFVSMRMIYIIGGVLYMLTGFYALTNKALRESHMDIEIPSTS